jgi:acyl-CoA synthetase (AMP-forming)/AMP-acid ligase II
MAAVVDVEGQAFMPLGEVGELILSGPNIMQGYWKRPKETAEAMVELEGRRWLRTGDLVRMDDEGYFHFFDRKRDLIKYKGYSVFARHVEEVLYKHPQVKAAGVVGVQDPKVGQIVKAYVVLQSEARGKVSEVARAIATEPELLLLDEPFGGLSPAETELMAMSIKRLHKGGRFGRLHSEGPAMIIVEHKLQQLMKIVTRIIVLDFGTVIADGTPDDVVKSEQVIKAYLGQGGV